MAIRNNSEEKLVESNSDNPRSEVTESEKEINFQASMGLPIVEPRVPDPHPETSIEDEKLLSDLYIRTSWFDAALALDQIEKVSRTSEKDFEAEEEVC